MSAWKVFSDDLDFTDADVGIELPGEIQYELHSSVLKYHSEFFRRILGEGEDTPVSSTTLDAGGFSDGQRQVFESGRFGRIDIRFPNKACQLSIILSMSFPNPKDKHLYQQYDNIFRACYQRPLLLEADNVVLFLRDAHTLVKLAESLGSLEFIGVRIDAALIQQGQQLYQSIAGNPVAWISIARLIQSCHIYRESVVHMVGLWSQIKQREDIADYDRKLCELKQEDLDALKMATNGVLITYYPPSLRRLMNQTNELGSFTVHESRQVVRDIDNSSIILMWMALSLFRQWVSWNLCVQQSRQEDDGGYSFYRRISLGGPTYLNREAVERFEQTFGLGPGNSPMLAAQVEELKEQMKPSVSKLMKNECNLDLGRYPVMHLTCVKVAETDVPFSRYRETNSRAVQNA